MELKIGDMKANHGKRILSICVAAILLWLPGSLFGQETKVASETGGKPFVQVFSNFNADFTESEIAPAFEIKRAYLGYNYKLGNGFSLKANIDIGKPSIKINDSTKVTSPYHYTAYLKNALLNYKNGKWDISFGMLGLRNFSDANKIWGHRYIMKTFQDQYKIAPSTDVGLIVANRLNDKMLLDLTLRNGEGFKSNQLDNKFNLGLGASFLPIDGLILRLYCDYSKKTVSRTALSGFLGYNKGKLSTGFEYNYVLNEKYVDQQVLNGFSYYASYDLNYKIQVFGRYDDVGSNKTGQAVGDWNLDKDGSQLIAGLQYAPTKGVKTALNFQGWSPENGDSYEPKVFLNFEYKFK